jgi:hypothetical protein
MVECFEIGKVFHVFQFALWINLNPKVLRQQALPPLHPPDHPHRRPLLPPLRLLPKKRTSKTIESILVAYPRFCVSRFVVKLSSFLLARWPHAAGHIRCEDCGYQFDINYPPTDPTTRTSTSPTRPARACVRATFRNARLPSHALSQLRAESALVKSDPLTRQPTARFTTAIESWFSSIS